MLKFFIFILIFSNIHKVDAKDEGKFLRMPDGNSIQIKPGQTADEAWIQAWSKFPKSFGLYVIPDEKIMDLDWFNECRAKAVKGATIDLAVVQIVKACKYQAVPKKCRNFEISKDYLGNEIGEARIKCVEQCEAAGMFSKRVGECRKG